jgi:uncharacterized protein (DUF1778 family)
MKKATKTKHVHFLMTPEQYEEIRKAAEELGTSVGDFLCRAANFVISRSSKLKGKNNA